MKKFLPPVIRSIAASKRRGAVLAAVLRLSPLPVMAHAEADTRDHKGGGTAPRATPRKAARPTAPASQLFDFYGEMMTLRAFYAF